MKSFTLDNLKRDINQDNLFNIFKQTYVDKTNKLTIFKTYVERNEEMRLDKLSERIYGSIIYEEELMIMNNIVNMYSIKEGDEIKYTYLENIGILKELEKELETVYDKLAKPNKNTRIDSNRKKGVPPTIKPKGLENLTVNKKTKKIQISSRIS